MSEKNIYFITGNHRSFKGIKDYYHISKEIFKNYKIIKKKKIQKNSINIIIENFKKKDVDEIIKYKKKYNSKIVLVLTEFLNKKAEIYNCFELNKNFYKFIPFHRLTNFNIVVTPLLLYLIGLIFYFKFENYLILFLLIIFLYIFIFNLTITGSYYHFKQFIKKILIKNINLDIKKYRKFKKYYIISYKKKKFIPRIYNIVNSNFFQKIFMYRYFKDRYLQVSKVIKLSNMVLVSHPSIYKDNIHINKNTHYIFSMIKNFKPNKPKNYNRIFKFSGDLTSYRFSFFLKLRKKLLFKSNIKNSYEIFLRNIELKKKKFIDINDGLKFKYSFHPKKNYEWQFSSPIRYIESIKKGEIPIIFQKFTDPISKKLAFYINVNSNKNIKKFFLRENLNIKLLKKNIIFYNSIVKKNNIKILKKIKNLEVQIGK